VSRVELENLNEFRPTAVNYFFRNLRVIRVNYCTAAGHYFRPGQLCLIKIYADGVIYQFPGGGSAALENRPPLKRLDRREIIVS
jgi:hypothetical protein